MTDIPRRLGGPSHSRLDHAIDRAVRDMMHVDPRPGFRRRVLAHLGPEPVHSSVRSRFVFAAAALAVLVLARDGRGLHSPFGRPACRRAARGVSGAGRSAPGCAGDDRRPGCSSPQANTWRHNGTDPNAPGGERVRRSETGSRSHVDRNRYCVARISCGHAPGSSQRAGTARHSAAGWAGADCHRSVEPAWSGAPVERRAW